MAVKFRLNMSDIKDYKFNYYVNSIIDYVLSDDKDKYQFRVESYSVNDIPASKILDIIEIEEYWHD